MRRLGKRRGDLRALGENRVMASVEDGAGAVGAAIAAVAVIEAVDELGAAHGGRAFVLDDLLHLLAPQLAFLGAAELAQIVDGSQDLGEPQKLRVVGPVVGRRRSGFPSARSAAGRQPAASASAAGPSGPSAVLGRTATRRTALAPKASRRASRRRARRTPRPSGAPWFSCGI